MVAALLTLLAFRLHAAQAEGEDQVIILRCSNICECDRNYLQCSNRAIQAFDHMARELLIGIDLSVNSISQLTESTFQMNSGVHVINMAHNLLETLPPAIFKGLPHLVSLNISFNRLVYTDLSSAVFSELFKLEILSMNNQGQQQENLPRDIFSSLHSLDELHITGSPRIDARFTSMKHLRLLNLGDKWCNMPDITDEHFPFMKDMANLSIFSVKYCKVLSMEPGMLNHFKAIKVLDTSCNPGFSRYLVPALNQLKNATLEVLIINFISSSDHQIDEFGKVIYYKGFDIHDILKNQPNLLGLSASQNYFFHNKTTPIHVDVPLLRFIVLDGHIDSLASLERMDSPLLALFYLLLDLFRINELRILEVDNYRSRYYGDDYSDCDSMHPLLAKKRYPWEKYGNDSIWCDVSCRDDYIRTLLSDPTDWNNKLRAPMPSITQEGLKETSIKVFKARFTSIPSTHLLRCTFNYTVYLDELDLSHSHAKSNDIWARNCTYSAPFLKRFSCRGCSLEAIAPHTFNNCPQLSFLDLAENKLGYTLATEESTIDLFRRLYKLQFLDLSSNSIYHLPSGLFTYTKELEHLDLHRNGLVIWTLSLSHCKKLKWLDLSHNSLKFITSTAIQSLPQNSYFIINLRQNHFSCDCSDETEIFYTWLHSSNKQLKYSGNYQCYNRNMTVHYWANHQSEIDCNISGYHWIKPVVGSLTAAIVLIAITVIIYINRFPIMYKLWSFKAFLFERNTASDRMPLHEHHGTTVKLSVYLAVDELEEIQPFLIRRGLGFFSRNEQGQCTGYKWENAVRDIASADVVVITLDENVDIKDELKKDFMYANQKEDNQIVTVTKGSKTSLVGRSWAWGVGALIKRLLNHTQVVGWPRTSGMTESQGGQLENEASEEDVQGLARGMTEWELNNRRFCDRFEKILLRHGHWRRRIQRTQGEEEDNDDDNNDDVELHQQNLRNTLQTENTQERSSLVDAQS